MNKNMHPHTYGAIRSSFMLSVYQLCILASQIEQLYEGQFALEEQQQQLSKNLDPIFVRLERVNLRMKEFDLPGMDEKLLKMQNRIQHWNYGKNLWEVRELRSSVFDFAGMFALEIPEFERLADPRGEF